MNAPLSYMPLTELDSRARAIFREVVETYLATGLPVGSKTLSLTSGQSLSPASIRSTLASLSRLGLLDAPHVSAGRVPTQSGLRLFVDGLLEVGDLSRKERDRLARELDSGANDPDIILEQASGFLSGLAGGAGLVLAPPIQDGRDAPLRHVEFVALDNGQALVVMVYQDGHVENRLMPRPDGLLPATLNQAGQFLSSRLRGRRLSEARAEILAEIEQGRAQIDRAASKLIQAGLADWTGGTPQSRRLIVRGQARLLDNLAAQTDLEYIRQLFDELDRQEDLIALLDRAEMADGVKIFIGSENPLASLSGSAMVIAPLAENGQEADSATGSDSAARPRLLGALAVIGPTRLNYARVIPMVDYTAQWVSNRLGLTIGSRRIDEVE